MAARKESERRRTGGYRGDGSRPAATSTYPHIQRDVCREMGLVRAPASGCVPGQSAPLPRTKRQRLKFQEGGEGGREGAQCHMTWHGHGASTWFVNIRPHRIAATKPWMCFMSGLNWRCSEKRRLLISLFPSNASIHAWKAANVRQGGKNHVFRSKCASEL